LRVAHSAAQVCAMRLSLATKLALSENRPARSCHPIVLAEGPVVEKPWTERPGQVSSRFRTSAVAIVTIE